MAANLKNLSHYDHNVIPDAKSYRFGIVVSEWNEKITNALYEGASDTLRRHGALPENIIVIFVPGSFELPLGASLLLSEYSLDAVICIGCVIRGETRHFEFICQAVAKGIMDIGLKSHIPVIFGVLTTENLQQATDRAGGIHGNKGIEAAVTAIKMAAIKRP